MKIKKLTLSLNSDMGKGEIMRRFADICEKMNEIIDVINEQEEKEEEEKEKLRGLSTHNIMF